MWPFKDSKKKRLDFYADGLGVRSRSLGFMEDPRFIESWEFAKQHAKYGFVGKSLVPDLRWRAHIAIWVAFHCSKIEGAFVECGVFTGLLSLSICKYLNFEKLDKEYWLYDIWGPIPLDTVLESERTLIQSHNDENYRNEHVYEHAVKAFSTFPNCKLIRGLLPGTLEHSPSKIAYLAVDLNNAPAEKSCIEILWPRVSVGGMVLIDDYGWKDHEIQRDMWDEFASEHDHMVVTLPTGQGLIVKHA